AECGDAGWNQGGTYNSVTITPNIGEVVSADDCVDIPDPEISVVKSVRDGQPVQVSGAQFAVSYDIEVTNGGEGPGTYSLTDLPDVASGATIDSVVVTPDPAGVHEILPGESDVY